MPQPPLYPLQFDPIFQRYLWGGRRLADVLGKPIGEQTAAESWEIVDHGDDQSIVAFGPLAGKSLHQLMTERGQELVGDDVLKAISAESVPEHLRLRFPLLMKFLDANQNLSVQVHPNDAYGTTLAPPDLGKTEAWFVMHADAGAKIYAGLKSGVSQQDFESAITAGETESTLHSFMPQTGDCVFIPAGTMHAIGAGLLIAEIQQASNTTFRVYDWGRVAADGTPRPLHIRQAIEVTDFSRGPVTPVREPMDHPVNQWAALVDCDYFSLKTIHATDPIQISDNQFHLLAVTQGSVIVDGDPSGQPLSTGQTMLIPASLETVTLTPVASTGDAQLLNITN